MNYANMNLMIILNGQKILGIYSFQKLLISERTLTNSF